MSENIKFTTSRGLEVELKPYLSIGDFDKIQIELYNEMVISTSKQALEKKGNKDAEVSVKGINVYASETKIVESMLVSVNGVSENVVDQYKKVDHNDGLEIKAKVRELTNGKKKNSETQN